MGGIGLSVYLVLGVGLIISLTLLIVRALRQARLPDVFVPNIIGGLTSEENLQARYTQGGITREQSELVKQAAK